MPKDPIKISYIGSQIVLEREQWRGHSAYISDYPGLLDAVLSYTWTYSETDHPYLRCGKLNKTLHYFVLAYLYGQNVMKDKSPVKRLQFKMASHMRGDQTTLNDID